MPRPIEVGRLGGRRINLTPEDRSTALHVIGASGQGKSKFLEHMIRQDIRNGHGVCVIDPHGTLYDALVKWCTYHGLDRRRKIHLINPSEAKWTVGFNPLWVRDGEDIERRVDRVVDGFAKVWGGEDSTSLPRLTKVLTCVFFALAKRRLSLVEGADLLSSSNRDGLRKYLSSNLDHTLFDRLWADFNSLKKERLHEYFESTDSRFMRFLASPTIRAMLGSIEQPIDFRKCMDNDEIVLVNLKESGKLSFQNASVIGALIFNELFSLASERDEALAEKHPFYVVVDECYRFLSSDIEDMLNQTRKRGLHVALVHQYLYQLEKAGEEKEIYKAIMTNAQTKMVFGGASDEDAEILAKEVFRTELDYDQIEDVLSKPVPTGRFYKETLNSWSSTDAESEGYGIGEGDTDGASSAVVQMYDQHGQAIGGYTEVSGSSAGKTASSSQFSSSSHSETEGTHEVLVPEYALMPTAFKSPEKVMHEAVVRLRKLKKRFAIIKRPDDERSVYLKIPFVDEPPVPERYRTKFINRTIGRNTHALPQEDALEVISERRRQLVFDSTKPVTLEH